MGRSARVFCEVDTIGSRPAEALVELLEVTLAVPDDSDGSGAALRGWIRSAGPEMPWRVRPPEPADGPADGQGALETISVVLDSAVAMLTLYDRVRLWNEHRRGRARRVTATMVLEIDGVRRKVTVTVDPPQDDGNGRTA
jgi:hypothetical protein